MTLLFVVGAPAQAAQEDESWTHDGYIGCSVSSPWGFGALLCGSPPGAPAYDASEVFEVDAGIEAVEVSYTWESDFVYGADVLQVRLGYERECALPNCFTSSESGTIFRTVGDFTLEKGESARFDDTTIDTTQWSFAGVEGPENLELAVTLGRPDGIAFHYDTPFTGNVIERYY